MLFTILFLFIYFCTLDYLLQKTQVTYINYVLLFISSAGNCDMSGTMIAIAAWSVTAMQCLNTVMNTWGVLHDL